MNIKKEFDGEDTPKSSNDIMTSCMAEIHDTLMVPMHDKLDSQQHSILMLVGIALKIIAEKASLYEAEHEGNDALGNLDKHHRN